MEQMSQGLLHVSKGKNIIVVETKITNKSTQVQADKELYEFVDNLLDHGYEIPSLFTCIYFSGRDRRPCPKGRRAGTQGSARLAQLEEMVA